MMNSRSWITLATGLSVATLVACQQSGQAAEADRARTARAPAAAATRTLGARTQFSIATTRMITSRTAKAGDLFSATVVRDVRDGSDRITIPAGSVIAGTVSDVKAAPSPSKSGTLTLAVNSVTIRGRTYTMDASIDSLATVRDGRAVNAGDAAKVGAGAAAGAIVGQVIGKNTRGTVIGAVVGGAAGAGYAAATKDSDIRLDQGTHILVTLNRSLTITQN